MSRAAARLRLAARFGFDRLDPYDQLRLAYQVVLDRDPDPAGVRLFLPQLQRRTWSPAQFVEFLLHCDEFFRRSYSLLGPALHASRCAFVRSLPPADRILDLGGTHRGLAGGALVGMGYPYPFRELVIVDLPHDERHEIYRSGDVLTTVDTPLGPVRYAYHSMVDLSVFGDGEFDLVYSGQSIEHVTPEEADGVLAEVCRVLRPGGVLALDTPNGRATRLQQEEFIDPDHKVEYEAAEIEAKITAAGLEIVDRKGLNYLGSLGHLGYRDPPAGDERFDEAEVATNVGMFAAADECYLLAYVARKPTTAA